MIKYIIIGLLILVLYYGFAKLAFSEDKTVFGYDTNKIINYKKLFNRH